MTPREQQRLLDDVEAYCTELRPSEELCYLEHRYNPAIIELARKYDLLGMMVPVEYGGRGADAVTYARALTRIGREGTGVRTFFSGHSSIGQYPIVRYGSQVLRQKYLPASVRGECILAFGLTEPEAGSNPLELTSTYRREGGGFVLNGIKYLISNGSIAHVVIVFAYPEQAAGSARRMSAFVVETSGGTMEREDLPAKLGMFTANTGMFQMTNHPVPPENLLGEEGEGFRIAMGTLVSGRLSVAAGCVGVMEDCLAECLAYARQRHQQAINLLIGATGAARRRARAAHALRAHAAPARARTHPGPAPALRDRMGGRARGRRRVDRHRDRGRCLPGRLLPRIDAVPGGNRIAARDAARLPPPLLLHRPRLAPRPRRRAGRSC